MHRSTPAEDERLYVAFASPCLVLRPAGVQLEPFAQISSRSRGVAKRAVACQVSPSIDTVASGLALRWWYQAGCFAPPKLDAMRPRPLGCEKPPDGEGGSPHGGLQPRGEANSRLTRPSK